MSSSIVQFAPQRTKIQVFLDRYQYILSILATFLFFSDLPDYLHSTNILPLNPLAWFWIFVILALPFFKNIVTMPRPMVIGMGLYALISLLSLATVSADELSMREFRLRILSILFVCLMYILYQQKSLKHIKYAIVLVVLMSIANNFFELLNPKIFSELNVGRPGGFYINPNKAGCALVLGLIFTVDAIAKPLRWVYILIIGMGISVTFSRGALLGWLICTTFFIIARVVSDRRRTIVFSTIALALLLVVSNPLKNATDYFQGSNDLGSNYDVLDRLEQFQNPSLSDESALERKAVVGYAWVMFGNHPFWGNGLASTHKWTVSEVSTHNMYLFYMADHGVLGFIILPGAILAVIYNNRGEPRVKILCYAIFMSLWGIFSHNVLEERYILLSFSLLAALNTNERWYLKYSNSNLPPNRVPNMDLSGLLPEARNRKALPSSYDRPRLPRNRP
jgi:hypothetical protein